MKHGSFGFTLAVMVAALTACGGGGGDGDGDTSPAPLSDLVSKYVGSWTSGCYTTGIVTDATTKGNANVKRTVVLTKVGNRQMTASDQLTVFASTDTTCAAAALGAIQWTGKSDNSYSAGAGGITAGNGPINVQVDGTATLGANQVEQITVSTPALTKALSANASVTAGGISINLSNFQASTIKDIAFQKDTQFTLGEPNGTNYPVALSTSPARIFTKNN